MNNEFRINILDKINNIEDEKVKKLCSLIIGEAQNNVHAARQDAIIRVNEKISTNLLKISEGII